MNLELLEEIHLLKAQDISDVEVAGLLGISKASMLLCLRMEKIISNKYEEELREVIGLKADNLSLSEKIDNLNDDLFKKEKLIDDLRSGDQIQEHEDLREDLVSLREDYNSLKYRYENIPDFIKRLF